MNTTHIAFFAWLALSLCLLGCAPREEIQSSPVPAVVAVQEQPMSGQGMEKLIPLRFVNLMDCSAPGTSSCPWYNSYESVVRAVAAANDVF